MYQYDASYAMEVARAHPGRMAIVKPVDPDDPAVADVIAEWKKTPGAVGIRIMLREGGRGARRPIPASTASRAPPSATTFRSTCCAGATLDAGMAADRPPSRDALHHRSPRPSCSRACRPRRRNPWADLPKVLELAKRPNAVIKVSGACTLSREPYPFPDIWDPLPRVFDAWGFERCLWGTDWTRAFAVVNYEQAVKPFLETKRLSDGERAMLMGGACAKAYGWSDTSRSDTGAGRHEGHQLAVEIEGHPRRTANVRSRRTTTGAHVAWRPGSSPRRRAARRYPGARA